MEESDIHKKNHKTLKLYKISSTLAQKIWFKLILTHFVIN
jgi:hypothetical protein